MLSDTNICLLYSTGLKADDRLIQKEGMDRMSHNELQNANLERGMPAFGLSEERLKAQLGEWIDLSLNYKVPPSLLLLSRTLYNIDNLAPTQKIASAISALPEKAASATSATIGEREGNFPSKSLNVFFREIICGSIAIFLHLDKFCQKRV